MPLIKPSPRRSTDMSTTSPESQSSYSQHPPNRGVNSPSPSSPSPRKQRSWTSFGSRAPNKQHESSYQDLLPTNSATVESPSRSSNISRSPEVPQSPQRRPPPPPAPKSPTKQSNKFNHPPSQPHQSRGDSLITHYDNNSTTSLPLPNEEDLFFRPPRNSNPNTRPAPNFSWKLNAQPKYPRRLEPDTLDDLEGPLSRRKREEERREGERDRRWD